jgi:hypothetical protein
MSIFTANAIQTVNLVGSSLSITIGAIIAFVSLIALPLDDFAGGSGQHHTLIYIFMAIGGLLMAVPFVMMFGVSALIIIAVIILVYLSFMTLFGGAANTDL